MHSFFQPKAKKAKLEPKQQPRSVLSWNVNGLLSVVADKATSKPAAELKAFIKRCSPDHGTMVQSVELVTEPVTVVHCTLVQSDQCA